MDKLQEKPKTYEQYVLDSELIIERILDKYAAPVYAHPPFKVELKIAEVIYEPA